MDQIEREPNSFKRAEGLYLLHIPLLRYHIAACLLFLVSSVFAQSPSDFNYYKTITIQPSQIAGASALIDFPFLFSTTNAEFATVGNGGRLQSSNGYDILFANADGSAKLDHELEFYHESGQIIAWVKTDLDPSSTTILRIYFGSATALTDSSTPSTWSSAYQAVWHFDDNTDASATGAHLTNSGSTNSTNAIIGTSQNFDEGTYYQTGVESNLNINGNITLESWVNLDVAFNEHNANCIISAAGSDVNVDFPYYFNIEEVAGNYQIGLYWVFGGGWSAGDFEYITSIDLGVSLVGSWHHFAVTRDVDNDMVHFYVNGALIESQSYPSTSDPSPSSGGHTVKVGQSHQSTAQERLDGKLDEVRISNIVRTPEWLETSFNSISVPASFFNLSASITSSCDATFNYGKSSFCETEASPAATITGDVGGVFDSPDGNIVFDVASTGTINLLFSSKGGPYDIVYTAPGGCSDTLQIFIGSAPSVAAAGADQNGLQCGTSVDSTILAANTPTLGAGSWSITNGATGGSFDDSANPSAVFTGDVNTTYNLRWTITNNGCTSSSDMVVYFSPEINANAGTDIEVCGSALTSLNAVDPSPENGLWEVITPGITITDNSAYNTTVSGASGNSYDIKWTVSSASCSVSDTVTVYFRNVSAVSAGVDETVCPESVVTLAGSSPSIGTASWIIESGSGGAISDLSDPNAEFTGTIGTSYELIWRNTQGTCTEEDTVQINIQPLITVDAGSDQNICISTAPLAGNIPPGGTVQWTLISGTGSIPNSTSPTTTITGLAIGNNTIEYSITSAMCIYKDTVLIAVEEAAPTFSNTVTDTTFYYDSACTTSYLPSNIEALFTVADNCSVPTLSYNYSAWTTSCGNDRSQLVSVTATDAAGNAALYSFTVYEQDTIAPTFVLPPDLTVYRAALCSVDTTTTTTLIPTLVNDNCDVSPAVNYSDSFVAGACTGDVDITRTWTVSDACGNSYSADQNISIRDTTKPDFITPPDTIIYMDGVCTADTLTSNLGLPSNISDNCTFSNVPIYTDIPTIQCGGTYSFKRVWSFFDDCGNSKIDTQYIQVLDTIRPTFSEPADLTVYMDITCNADTSATIAEAGTVTNESDNCSSGITATYTNSINGGSSCGSGYIITRSWTLVDNCGNTTTKEQIITVLDTIAAVFTAPASISIYLDASCVYNADSSLTGSPTGIIDNCSDPIPSPTYVDNLINGGCEGEYLITRTWTVVDDCGNSRSSNQTIMILDTVRPMFTVPRDTSFYFNANCDPINTAIVFTGDVIDENDNCTTNLNATFSDVTNTLCGNSYQVFRTWNLIDNCGNSTSEVQTINVLDTTLPTYTIPIDITLYQDGNCRADTSFVGTGDVYDELDNCSAGLNAIYRDSVVVPVCVGSYVVYRLWTLADNCGNINRKTQVITVLDQVAPTFFTPQNDTVYIDNTCYADTTLSGLGNIISVLENCSSLDTSYTDIVTTLCEGSYRLQRSWTLTDQCGNSTSRDQLIVVLDTIDPSFTTPPDTILYLDINCSANLLPSVVGDVTDEMDNCTSTLNATYSDSSASGCGASQIITRIWVLNDACGNTSSDIQIITVLDTTAPSFIVPLDITIYKSSACTEDISIAITGDVATESDYCIGVNQATFSDTQYPNTCSGSYIIEREWTVADACGNSLSQVQTITVSDTTRPYFILPADRIVYTDGFCDADTAIATTGTVTAAGDNCDLSPILAFSQSISPVGCSGSFDIERTWTLMDNCGNARVGTQNIQVRDTLAPTLSIPADQTLYIGGGTSCSSLSSIGFESGYQSWTQGGLHCDIVSNNANSGSNSVRLQNNSSSSLINSPLIDLSSYSQAFIDFSYYVGHMNSGETFEVQVSNNGGGTYATIQTFQEGIDFVDGNRNNVSVSVPGGSLSSNIRFRLRLFGSTNFEQVFFDDLNIRGCTFDNTCAVNISPSTLGFATATSDNCTSSVSPTYSDIIELSCNNTYIARRVWTISDDCGNIRSSTQTIQILDTVRPEMIIPDDVTIYLDNVCTPIDTTTTTLGVATIIGDNCDPSPLLAYSDSYSNVCGQQVTIERLWTIEDACGNLSSAIQTISLIDTVSPVLSGIPAAAHYQCQTPDAAPLLYVGITASDGCDPSVVITFSESSTRTFDDSCSDVIYTITRTWTATDACGNSTSRTQDITASCECCNNGIDDDGDGAIDETDSDCPCTTSQVSLNCSPSYFYFVPSIWRMTGSNYDDPSRLVITTPLGTTNYTIRNGDNSYTDSRVVTSGTADEINLSSANILTTANNQIENDKGFIIESDQALHVLYQLDAEHNKLLISYKGEQALGQRFRTASQTNICGNNPAADDENHFISVMAAEDDTEVTFEFDFPLAGITSPHTVTLDAGETYLVRDEVRANQTVTGALVTADRPIAVVSGSQHTMTCNNSGGNAPGRDGGADQLVPTCLIGEDYVAVRGSGQDYSNYVIVVGVTASTAIYINGNASPVATVGPGEYYEYQLSGNSGDVHYIRTDRPAYAYQVGNLDSNNEPGMAIMSPVGNCRGESTVDFVKFLGLDNEVTVLVPTPVLSTLTLNSNIYSSYAGINTSAVPGLPTYTSVTIPDAHISSFNRLEADQPFIASQYVGGSAGVGAGSFSYLTSFTDEVIITNPSTGIVDFNYSLDTLCGGIAFNHCVEATSCAGGQYITDIIPGAHTASVFFDPTSLNTCFSYIGESGYDGFDDITVYIADSYGFITAICVDIYLCGSTPFIETIPADTLILCNSVVPSPPVFIPINAGCSKSYDVTYAADSSITYSASCSDYAFTITRSWRLTDNCGNDTTVYQQISITDTLDPFLTVPPDTLIFADGVCALDTLISQIGEAEDLVDNCDPSLVATYRDSFEVAPSCSGSFLIYRLWSLTDDCGNVFENEQIIEIRDTIAPTFTAPPDTLIFVDALCIADSMSINTGIPLNATDNCDIGLVSTYTDTSIPGCDGSFVITRTWTVSDDCGNYTQDTQTIEVRDTTGPILSVPSDTTLYFSLICGIDTSTVNLGTANNTVDNCDLSITPVYRDSVEMGCDRTFTTFRIWSATDDCGNESVQIQTIVIADTSRPTMSIPSDTTIYKSVACAIDTTIAALGDVLDEGDNCSLISGLDAIYDDVVSTNCNGGFEIYRTWTLEDGCGNRTTLIQTITVVDSSGPTFQMPRDTILYVDPSCNVDTSIVITGIASNIVDNCDPGPQMSYFDIVTPFCIGQYDVSRVWVLTDDCGNISRDTQLISVLDTVPPAYITPSNVTLYSDITCYADTSIINTGIARFENDNCDLTLNPTYSDSLGLGCGIGYEIFRRWSVVDDCGNNFQTTQVITILDRIDPTFTAPRDTILYTTALCFVDTTVTSTGDVFDENDNCDSLVDAIYTDVVTITCEGGYTIQRIWSVADDCGNGVQQIQWIEVRDTTAPTFTVPRDTILYSSATCVKDTLTINIGDVTDEADACDNSLQALYRDEINTPCEGSNLILRIWSLTDVCGNVTIDTQTITVIDTFRPSFTIPRDTILFSDISCVTNTTVSSTGDVNNEQDNCDTSLDATFADTVVNGCDGTYTITRTWSLSDDCGNTIGGDQIITVQDTTAPTFTTPTDITLYLDANCLVNNLPAITGDVTDENDGCDSSIDASYTDAIVSGCGNSYVLTRTWTASDNCGNTYADEQVITVLDTLVPNYVLPNDATLYLDVSCNVDTSLATLGVPTSVTDNCGGLVTVTYNNTLVSSCEGSYEILRSWSFTDICANVVVDTQRIIVMDTIAPNFTPPADVVLYKSVSCFVDTTTLTNGFPTGVMDNCETIVDNITYTDNLTFPCEGAITIIRMWTITDDCGNSAFHDQTIEVRDTIRPLFTTPRDTTVYVANDCSVNIGSVVLGDITDESDNCDTSLDASYSDITSSVCGGSYDIERTWFLTDDCGNSISGIQTIHVIDSLKPTVIMPANVSLFKNSSCAVDSTIATLGSVSATDNCPGLVSISHVDQVTVTCEGSFDILRIWTISDLCMNTVIDTQYISVSDTTRPTFTIPADIDVFVNGICQVDTTTTATGDITDESDNCDTSLGAEYIDNIVNNCTGGYIIERNWTLTDDCGNFYSAIQQIHVRDTIPPNFSVPRDTTLYVDLNCQADTTIALIGDVVDESDNCSTVIEATYTDVVVSGCSGSYTMERTWILVDDCGNSLSRVQTISLLDTIRPTLTAPRDTVAYLQPNCTTDTMTTFTGALMIYGDNCDNNPSISYTDTVTSDCGASFTITRTWAVTDECGQIQSDVQIIAVLDTLKPTFTVPADITIYKNNGCGYNSDVSITGDVTDEADNCDILLDASFTDSSAIACEGESTLTRVWSLTDLCGNTSTATQTITVLDTIRPTFTVPSDITLYVNDICIADTTVSSTGDITDEADNCDTSLEATYVDTVTGVCAGSYLIVRNWILIDDCGNVQRADQTITVTDTIAPSFTVPADITLYDCGADTTITNTGDVMDEVDNCSTSLEATYSDATVGGCEGSYTIQRTWTLTDDCGNATSDLQTIQIMDTTSPSFTVPLDVIIYLDFACMVDTSTTGSGDVIDETDNCDTSLDATYSDIITPDCGGGLTISRTWSLSDDCGNSTSQIQTILILDAIAPELIGVPVDAIVDCSNIPMPPVVTATDNCSSSLVVNFSEVIGVGCPFTIIRTWEVTDDCGNQTILNQSLLVEDVLSPTFSNVPADITVDCITNIPPMVDLIWTDDCDGTGAVTGVDKSILTLSISSDRAIASAGDLEVMDSGSYVIDMGVVPQTVNNGLKPYGLIYSLLSNYNVPVKWVIQPGKLKDEIDFSENGIDYRGGPFIIPGAYITNEVDSVIAAWELKGVVGNKIPTTVTVPVYKTIDYIPHWGLDLDKGDIAEKFFEDAEIPNSAYEFVLPTELDSCYSIFVLPHADPNWGSHANLYEWNKPESEGGSAGAVWVGCHSGSAVENSINPVDPTKRMNFLMRDPIAPETNPAAPHNDHDDGSPAYQYAYHDHPIMQFIGPLDGATENGSEQVFLPTNGWRPTTKLGVWDDTQIDVPGLSPGPAGVLVFGQPYGNEDRGIVSYTGGHNIRGSNPENIAAMRSFFNFSLYAAGLKAIDLEMSIPTGIKSGQSYAVSALATGGMGQITYEWQSECAGTFADPNAAITTFTPGASATGYTCRLSCIVKDECNIGTSFLSYEIEVLAQSSGDCYENVYRCWSYTDACGNESMVYQTITIRDTIAPIIDIPADVTVHCDAIPAVPVIIPTDNCTTNLLLNFNEVISAGCPYIITRTWDTADDCGNTSSQVQTITVIDTTAPSFTVPADIIVFNCGADTTIVNTGDVLDEVDNCSTSLEATYSDIVVGGCIGSYTIQRIWTLTDDCGNSTSELQTIQITDTTRPSFTVPIDTILYLDFSCMVDTSATGSGDVIDETDNCDTSLGASYSDIFTPGCGEAFTITRTWSLTDDCGNLFTSTQTIAVLDTLRPTFTTPSDITLYVDVNCNTNTTSTVTGDVTDETDNCDTSLDATFTDSTILDCQGGYQIQRTWVLNDGCGNSYSDVQVITVLDTIRPTFTVPSDITLYLNNMCAADTTISSTGEVLDEADNCDTSLDATYIDTVNGVCAGSYILVRTWTLMDDCGNVQSADQTITVTDTTAPSFTVPADIIVFNCGADTTIVNTGDVLDEVDNCSTSLEATYSDIVVGGCIGSYAIQRTWTLTDDCGNSTSELQTIQIMDTTSPSFTVPIDTILYLDFTCMVDTSVIGSGDVLDETDNCDATQEATYSDIFTPGCGDAFTITRIWSLSDDCGNLFTSTQTITVLDTLRPTFTTPSDITLYVDVNCNTNTTSTVTGDITDETDNCDTSLEATFTDSTIVDCQGGYQIQRTWVLNDDCGNSYSDVQVITVLDTIRPTFTVPLDITLYLDNMCIVDTLVTNTGDVTDESDNCDSTLEARYTDAVTAVCNWSYSITRTWTLTDGCGNSTTGDQIITVTDNTAPTFTTPRDTTIYMDITCRADTTILATGDVVDESDGCDSMIDATYSDVVTVNCTNSYVIIRTWRLADDCNNESIGVQTITVLDTIRPSFTIPQDTTLYKDSSCLFDSSASNTGDVTDEVDNCDAGVAATYSDSTSGSCEGEVIITRTWTLTDDCGNASSGIQTITILDTILPSFTTPADTLLYVDDNCNVTTDISATGDVTDETDNCDTSVNATYNDVVTANCSGSYIIARTWSLVDDCGNLFEDVQLITVLDTIRPSFTIPADISLNADASCVSDITISNTGYVTDESDNCTLTANLEATFTDSTTFDCIGSYAIQRTWVLSDACGNTTTGIQIITVVDNTPPSFSTPNDTTVYLDVNCTTDISPAQTGLVNDAADGCDTSIAPTYIDVLSNTCGGSYILERRWEASDLCGNTRNGIQVITVLDTTAPIFITPVDTTLYLDDVCFADTTVLSTGNISTITEGCDSVVDVQYQDSVTEICGDSYIIERTWLVSDQCNNTSSSIQVINVQDTLAPNFTVPPNLNVFLDNLNLVDTSLAAVGNVSSVSDNCSNSLEITYRDSIVTVMAGQVAFESYRFWTMTDMCGNTSTRQQLIGFLDTIPPTYITPPTTQVDCEFIPLPDTIVFSDINGIVDISMTEAIIDTPCIDRYTIVRTWTASDGAGNEVSVDRVILVTTCNTTLSADISNSTPCLGEFVSLNSTFSHPTHINGYFPRWFFRQQPTDSWTPVPGGDQSNLTFPAYSFRSGAYKVIYASQADHLDPQTCQYDSDIINLNVAGQEQITHRNETICDGETFVIGNATFFAEGDYNIIYSNSTGCDSIVTLHLTVLKAIAQISNITLCDGEYFELSDGTRYEQSGTYFDSLLNVNNCDSIIVTNLTVAPRYRDTLVQHICTGDTLIFNGRNITTAGLYTDTLHSVSSCDSIVVIDLSVIGEIRHTEQVTICSGDSYAFDGYLLFQDTIWQKSYTSMGGCDSIVTLELNIVEHIYTTIFDTTCYQEPFNFGNWTILQSGVYRDTFTSRYGCDSIVELNLHMRDEISASFDIQLCAGESFEFKNNSYTNSQILTDVVSSAAGCDSTTTFNLQIASSLAVNADIVLCAGDSILIGSSYVKSSGSFTHLFANAQGCLDSTINYNVTVADAIVEDRNITLCAGDSILIGNTYYRTDGSYNDVQQSRITGCDSIITTHLFIEDIVELFAEDVNICQGESFTLLVDGADNLSWSSSNLLSCDNCPNPSGIIDQTTTFTATTLGCANQQISIDVVVTVFNEVQIEVLTPDTIVTYGESILLDAFVTDPFAQITWYDQLGNVLCSNCSSVEVSPTMSTFYYAEANGDSDCTVSDTVRTDIKNGCSDGEIIVPNFISPNGDGINDDVRVRYNAIQSINKMRIFNRWGQLIFKTDDVDNDRWDGSVNNGVANPGVYIYFIEYQCLNGDEVFLKGNITVLR